MNIQDLFRGACAVDGTATAAQNPLSAIINQALRLNNVVDPRHQIQQNIIDDIIMNEGPGYLEIFNNHVLNNNLTPGDNEFINDYVMNRIYDEMIERNATMSSAWNEVNKSESAMSAMSSAWNEVSKPVSRVDTFVKHIGAGAVADLDDDVDDDVLLRNKVLAQQRIQDDYMIKKFLEENSLEEHDDTKPILVKINDEDSITEKYYTPGSGFYEPSLKQRLFNLAGSGNIEQLQELISSTGIKIDNITIQSAIEYAIEFEEIETVKFLVSLRNKQDNIKFNDKLNIKLLEDAVDVGSLATVVWLVDMGVPITSSMLETSLENFNNLKKHKHSEGRKNSIIKIHEFLQNKSRSFPPSKLFGSKKQRQQKYSKKRKSKKRRSKRKLIK
jgi:hypothetical protein